MKRAAAAIATAILLPTAALAQSTDSTQADSTRARSGVRQSEQDTARNRMDAQGRRNTEQGVPRRTRGESAGSVAAGRSSRAQLGLDRTQVTMLQQALRDAGCNPGAIDGRIGPRTRRAMSCAARNNNVEEGNTSALFGALGLNFDSDQSWSAQGNAGARSIRQTDANQDPSRDRVGGQPPRDTTQAGGQPPR